MLTQRGQRFIYVTVNWGSIGSGNGLLPDNQAIAWIYVNEILIQMKYISMNKMYLTDISRVYNIINLCLTDPWYILNEIDI